MFYLVDYNDLIYFRLDNQLNIPDFLINLYFAVLLTARNLCDYQVFLK